MRSILVILLLHLFPAAHAQADTVDVYSNAMHTSIKCVVITPSTYSSEKMAYPVIYLLHGYGGSYRNWIMKMPGLKKYATDYKTIVVCPDANFNSWYVDSPVDSTVRFETFMAAELVNYIDKNYRTLGNREHRGISGLSMGGHGALMLALRHPDVFGAGTSLSGAVKLEDLKTKYDMQQKLGDTIRNIRYWDQYSVNKIADTVTGGKVRLMIDCGTKDIFINANRLLHQKLLARNIAHDYIERDGEHNWAYWTNALPYHLLFLHRFFTENERR